jgi:hypothetical protein
MSVKSSLIGEKSPNLVTLARVLNYIRRVRLQFIGPILKFQRYEELWLRSQGLYLQHFIFCVIYKWDQ